MVAQVNSRLLAQRAVFNRLYSKVRRSPLQAGFTLIELLIVVIIIGVLASIALPAFLNQQNKAKVEAAQSSAIGAARACATLAVTGEHGSFSPPAGVTGTCEPSGTASTFTGITNGTTTVAVATVSANGAVSFTQCAAASGVTAGTVADGC